MRRFSFRKRLILFFAGAVAGGAAVALTTPVTGPKVRRAVRRTIEDASDQVADAKETIACASDKLLQYGGSVKKTAARVISPLG